MAPRAPVDLIAELLHAEIGLRPESSLRGRLDRCVREGAATRGLSLEAYHADLLHHDEAFSSLIDEITVQETGFFRHPEQFDVLAEILPSLTEPVTLWSAGCANGQEAFSLAMLLDEQGIAGSVVATDLSAAAVERTARARYSTREIAGLSAERRSRHLRAVGAEWEVDEPLRRQVTAAQHNLVDAIPALARTSQVVFCRNILIYLSAEHTRAFLDRVADAFAPGTPLFLGAAEVLWQVSDRFEPVRVDSTYLYRCRHPRRASNHPASVSFGPALDRAERARPAAPRTPRRAASAAAAATDDTSASLALARVGQDAIAAGDHRAAVVAFRAWAYLTPLNVFAQLHLGLALEAAGDLPAARRTFGVARRALLGTDPTLVEVASEGYSFAELGKLLDAKQAQP